MKASPSDQRQILDIQRHDLALTSLAHKLATLPEIAALSAATVKSNNTRDLRIAAETELSDVNRELKRAEGDVEQVVARLQKDETGSYRQRISIDAHDVFDFGKSATSIWIDL